MMAKKACIGYNKFLKLIPHAVVVLITAYGEVDLAVKAMKNGAVDFVLKPWKNQKLLGTDPFRTAASVFKKRN